MGARVEESIGRDDRLAGLASSVLTCCCVEPITVVDIGEDGMEDAEEGGVEAEFVAGEEANEGAPGAPRRLISPGS